MHTHIPNANTVAGKNTTSTEMSSTAEKWYIFEFFASLFYTGNLVSIHSLTALSLTFHS